MIMQIVKNQRMFLTLYLHHYLNINHTSIKHGKLKFLVLHKRSTTADLSYYNIIKQSQIYIK